MKFVEVSDVIFWKGKMLKYDSEQGYVIDVANKGQIFMLSDGRKVVKCFIRPDGNMVAEVE